MCLETIQLIEKMYAYVNYGSNEVLEFVDRDANSPCFEKVVGRVFSRMGTPEVKQRLKAVTKEIFGGQDFQLNLPKTEYEVHPCVEEL